MKNQQTPYYQLDPNLILAALESIGLRCSGSLLALNSYENRVYQIGIDEAAPIIAKFYRPERWTTQAILEEHQFALELVERDVPVVAPFVIENQTLHIYQGFKFALFPRQGGRALELDNLQHLEWMGRFIGRLHAVSQCRAFTHRLSLNLETYGYKPWQFLQSQDFIPQDLKVQYADIVEQLLQKAERLMASVGEVQQLRLHGDCHIGNVLWNEQGPHIVDLDDCLMGPAIQDIWMLVSGNTEQEVRVQLNAILNGYEDFCEFNYRELKLIEVLRSLRMIHYSAWLARRWDDPAFPANFPWFGSRSYWQEQIQSLIEQVRLIETESALVNWL